MNKIFSVFLMLVISLESTANESYLLGNWSFDLPRGRGAGKEKSFKITQDKLLWRWDGEKFLCLADYAIVYEGKGKSYPYNKQLVPYYALLTSTTDYLFTKILTGEPRCEGEYYSFGGSSHESPFYLQIIVWTGYESSRKFWELKNIYTRGKVTIFEKFGESSGSGWYITNLDGLEKWEEWCNAGNCPG